MSLAIDAIILFAAVFIIWLGANRGFIRSIMSLISTVASLIAAYAFTPTLTAHISNTYLMERITAGIEKTLGSLARDPSASNLYNFDKLTTDLPTAFTDLLQRYNINLNAFVEKLRGLTGSGENTLHDLAGDIATPTASLLSSVISFIVIFIAARLLLKLITAILDAIFHLPVLKTANMFFGFLFGLIEAVAVALVLAILLSTLVTALGAIDPNLFGADAVEKTVICKHLLDLDLFNRIYDVLR